MPVYEVDYSLTIRGSHAVEASDKESAEKVLSVMPLSELANLPGALDWEVEAVEVK